MKEKGIFDISERVALVTGGGSGLGRVFCETMAEFGADVVCCDINESGAQETVRLIDRFGHRTLAIKADVSKPHEVESMVNKTVAEMGAIDILFNNAGISMPPARVHELSIENWDRTMAVNLRGVFLCMRTVLPVMIKQKRGCIINISSMAAIRATPTFPHADYNASKAGVSNLTRQAAVEYAKDGIRINAIAPGSHSGTNIGKEWKADWTEEKQRALDEMFAKNIPMGRTAAPSELEGLAIYLASDASSFVTGQTFIQDGGLSL